MIVYLVTCLLCPDKKQYTGQTIRRMADRHRGHRAEVKSASDGLGEHFHKHLLDTQVVKPQDGTTSHVTTLVRAA